MHHWWNAGKVIVQLGWEPGHERISKILDDT